LVRDILGHEEESIPPLSKGFRDKLQTSLKFEVPQNAWWGTDYHISWLAGALAVYIQGESAIEKRFPNPRLRPCVMVNTDSLRERQLVEGNQEDVDLVISTGQDLILIEAKAYDRFTNEQINSKLARLDLLYQFYKELGPTPDQAVRFYFVLQWPVNPTHLGTIWRPWMCNSKETAWITLKLNRPMSLLEVTRCDDQGRSAAIGLKWRIFMSKHNDPVG